MMEVLRPMIDELRALKEELEDTKSTLDVYKGAMEGDGQVTYTYISICSSGCVLVCEL